MFPGMVLEAPNPAQGITVPPGKYQVRLTADGLSRTQPFSVERDPRLDDITDADYADQYRLAVELRDATSRANEAVIRIRSVKSQLKDVSTTAHAAADALAAALTSVESELYQIKNQSPKDKIANPIKLNDRLAGLLWLVQMGDGAPTRAQRVVAKELVEELERHLARLESLTTRELRALNERLVAAGGKPVVIRQ